MYTCIHTYHHALSTPSGISVYIFLSASRSLTFSSSSVLCAVFVVPVGRVTIRLWSSGCRSRYQGGIGRLKFLKRPFCIIGKHHAYAPEPQKHASIASCSFFSSLSNGMLFGFWRTREKESEDKSVHDKNICIFWTCYRYWKLCFTPSKLRD